MVCVDVSGKSFDRMSCMRRSLVLRQPPSRKRRTRRQRRNTIATTDPKEIHQAARYYLKRIFRFRSSALVLGSGICY